MKKLITAFLIIAISSSLVFAQNTPVTGTDYQKLNKADKVQLITKFIQDVKKEGVTVSKEASFYCQKLDRLYSRKPNLLTEPLWKILKTAMIMEYDWKMPGVDSDKLAKDWLGEKLYNKNKERRAKKK